MGGKLIPHIYHYVIKNYGDISSKTGWSNGSREADPETQTHHRYILDVDEFEDG